MLPIFIVLNDPERNNLAELRRSRKLVHLYGTHIYEI